jgi:phosphopantothenoylcysteine decarboxylase/phosphopantothenate--cysteine ligase
VTAGPTREAIDPVRFVSNPSSGKMGYAVAKAAADRGADVILVSGPTSLETPYGVRRRDVVSAAEMAEAVFEQMDDADIIIKVAAVSDYAPSEKAEHKIKKGDGGISITMERTIDILAELGKRKKNQVLVGFAAETQHLKENALEKLNRKNLDMIAGNLVNDPSSGFNADTNKINLFFKDGRIEELPVMGKVEAAHILLDRIVSRIMKGREQKL